MHLTPTHGWFVRLLMSMALTVVGLAVLMALGQHIRIVNVILLFPGALIGIMILFIGDEIGISAALVEYVGEDGPVVYLLVSVLCMVGFWWLVAFAMVTKWTAQRNSKARINSRNGV